MEGSDMIAKIIRILLAPLCLCLPILAGAQTATVNFATTSQTIRGFGGSESWMPQFSTGLVNSLYGTGNNELGLSILRVRIDPSSTTGGSNWATELANAKEASALGATIIATPWTPPAAWKSSNSTVSDTGLAASTTYNYLVEAVDSDGSSAASSQASATTKSASSDGGTCTVNYTITPQNSSSFGATVAIENQGTTALSNWTLTWSFANGQTISSSWNGTAVQSSANVTVSEQSGQTWENIPAGGTYSGFGFNGTWNGITNSIPAAFSLNGTACTVN
jgi:Cellulose binding domain